MKVLSLLQPWASLVVMGEKRIETRPFNTKHRGPLLIHASLGKKGMKLMDDPAFKKHLTPLFMDDPRNTFPFGAIIGSVNLAGTSLLQVEGKDLPTGYVSADTGESWKLTDQEKAFGHYAPKRYGWLLKDPIMFPTPIPCKGDLGIRDILRPSAFAIVEEKVPYEKGVFGMLHTHYLTYYGQKVEGHICKEEADNALLTFFDHWKDSKADRSRMMGATRHWPRILEIEQQLFNPGRGQY